MTAAFNDDFVRQVEQMSRFQEQTHKLTSKCWDLCVDKPETRLGSRSETCLKNCVERFIDINNFITNRFEKSLMEKRSSDTSFD
ncbi:mitochondrial import inner membrane translocase subunit Tim8 A isoform X1 [Frankliniella occidentalis]|uniref:Mitochondrial import inner membrane translocase subunit n=1 Tax=Frankliniella occidentalis TaxID=133901 RepID=A0A9C6X6K3_FRAOC|nr:mitochondrial import inner membrane translocase subunit Tim8 A isoform X1 [Frankliniella occidentalis]